MFSPAAATAAIPRFDSALWGGTKTEILAANVSRSARRPSVTRRSRSGAA
jgi:hypothetical protein